MVKYSVLMSVYVKDNPAYLKTAIDSMLTQSIKPSEIVLVEDGPLTEALYQIIENFKKQCPSIMKIISLRENVGLGVALREGLNQCSYEFVARMDSDDVACARRIEEQAAYFDKYQSLDIVGGDIDEFIDSPCDIVSQRKVPCTDEEIKDYMKVRCPFNHMTVMFKKAAVLKAGNYQHWHYNEDYYLWIRMMESGCIMANTGTTLVKVRVGKEMYARRGGHSYFKSEKKLQDYMLQRGIISFPVYVKNVVLRFIIQKLLTPTIRGIIFKKFARS